MRRHTRTRICYNGVKNVKGDEILTTIIIVGAFSIITSVVWYLTTDTPLYLLVRTFLGVMVITSIGSLYADTDNGYHITHKPLKIIVTCIFIAFLFLSFINQ